MTFDLHAWHAGSSYHYVGQIRRSQIKAQGHRMKSFVKVVGATSSEGLLDLSAVVRLVLNQ